MTLTIEALKLQKRWVLWRLEERDGKPTKVPYQIPHQGKERKAASNNPATWSTYAEVSANTVGFSGVGVVLGEVDGIHVSGIDIDNCCDAVTGKFTPESREIVIGLDSYSEYSPSGTGCHILVIGHLRGRKGMKEPFQGIKAVELYDSLRYLTFTGRHLKKTPDDIIEREDALNALYDRVQAAKPHHVGLTVAVTVSEAERLELLMAGDMSLHNDDHSTADFALCCLLAKKHACNPVTIDDEFRKSGLYREKWERDDYRGNTIGRAIMAVAKEAPVIFADEDAIEEDGETEFLVESLQGPGNDGWFPKGELSIIGAPSGVGKTSWAMPLLEKIRRGEDVWGHKVSKPRDYRVLLHDRSKKAMQRTAKALHMSDDAMHRIIRLSTEQQRRQPAEILQGCVDACPGVEVWFIEGLDLWIPDMNKMNVVAPIVDSLQRIATRYNVAVLATVGAPKQKGKDRYFGRDALFGSAALARKVETVVLMSLHNEEDPNSARRCWILPRAGRAERMYFIWQNGGLQLTTEPDAAPEDSAFARVTAAVRAVFKPGEPVTYSESLGPESTFYRWKRWATERRILMRLKGKHCLAPTGCTLTEAA
ncbi:MAG TPA: AAA family ATPase [Terracidiphilus sp.]|nr:AAA family ATPase [Terracidiphilus sp.]